MSAVIECDSRIPGAPTPDLSPGRVAALKLLSQCSAADAMFSTSQMRRETLVELLACAFTLGRIEGLKVSR